MIALVNRMALRTQLEINASQERVWSVLQDYRKWQEWNSFLKINHAAGTLSPGEALQVTFQPPGRAATTMGPQVIDFQVGSEFKWRGKLWGTSLFFVGEHYFKLQSLGQGKTLLLHGEDFKGCLVPLLGSMLKDTEKGFQDFNNGLKQAAEAAQ
ncbi:hypothetical protein TSOC_006934 [Tetrabaena socialis]|uniref:Uncharacterized protein n=1 Tax=Tetrabaena socialis TaxID=47790 RepID=A0A2J8A2C9_9CHLO|nr:hypothetical protein TSOC_006934 [Tetrabaena socialis]|eukprot:PNH06665.1 hypothetical protein TSOC_006934 [Tetrabaena socialis]